MILLDTNVISELIGNLTAPAVAAFIRGQRKSDLFTSALCVAEIGYGIARLPAGRRRDRLASALHDFMTEQFMARVLPFDHACAEMYATARARRDRDGRPVADMDTLIAATALTHGATVATRHIRDFEDWGLRVVNPWDAT